MNRKTVLATIKAEYAMHGEMTGAAMRAYAESRIGFGAYTEAKKTGIKMYMEAQKRG